MPSFAAPAKAQAAGGGSPAAFQISKPAAMCGVSKQPLMIFCITYDKAICVSCAIDPARCKSHDTRQLASIVSCVRDAHAAWLQLRDGRPQQLHAEIERVDAAAEAAIQAIREEAEELKVELQRACVGELEGRLEEQAQLLADVEIAAASPEAAVAGSEACRCLRTAVTRGPRAPDEGCGGGRFEAVAAAAAGGGGGCGGGASGARVRRLGRIVVKGFAAAVRPRAVGAVAAVGAGFQRAFSSKGAGNGQFNRPFCAAFDHEGNVAVSDLDNHRIQVMRYSDGQHLRTIGQQGAGNGQFNQPYGVALDGAGHLIVAEYGNHRLQVLNYADGSHVRTIGSYGSGIGQFGYPSGVAIDGDGRIIVCDPGNNRMQVLQ